MELKSNLTTRLKHQILTATRLVLAQTLIRSMIRTENNLEFLPLF